MKTIDEIWWPAQKTNLQKEWLNGGCWNENSASFSFGLREREKAAASTGKELINLIQQSNQFLSRIELNSICISFPLNNADWNEI